MHAGRERYSRGAPDPAGRNHVANAANVARTYQRGEPPRVEHARYLAELPRQPAYVTRVSPVRSMFAGFRRERRQGRTFACAPQAGRFCPIREPRFWMMWGRTRSECAWEAVRSFADDLVKDFHEVALMCDQSEVAGPLDDVESLRRRPERIEVLDGYWRRRE
jgi:hypothetical protein